MMLRIFLECGDRSFFAYPLRMRMLSAKLSRFYSVDNLPAYFLTVMEVGN